MQLARARALAAELVDFLGPACARIEVAGSIRRKKPEVKDIELVLVPKQEPRPSRQASLFGQSAADDVDLADELLRSWLQGGWARHRLAKDGKAAFGPLYKRLEVKAAGWPAWAAVDVFSVLPPAQWGLIYMIRTGSGVGPSGSAVDGFAPAMLARWKSVSGGGYSAHGLLRLPDGRPVPTPEEEDVFRACRVVWVPPEERTSAKAVRASE